MLPESLNLSFTDVGTLCYLTGLRDPHHASAGPMSGAIFETAVLAEIYKRLVHRGENPQIYFWRTSSGMEVDFLIEHQARLIPIEVKRFATPRPEMALTIKSLRQDLGDRIHPGYVIHSGDIRMPLGDNAKAIPFLRT